MTSEIRHRSWSTFGPGLIGLLAGTGFYFLVAQSLLNVVIADAITPEDGEAPWACRVMSDPINLFSFVAFGVAVSLLLARRLHLRRESKAFAVSFLPDDENALLLPEDAVGYRKRFRQLAPNQQNFVLFRLLWSGLQRARSNWSAEDTGEAIKTQAELIQGEVDSQYSIVRYLAWAIPSIGFVGTVLGIGKAMGTLRNTGGGESSGDPLQAAAGYLNTAFDTTFVALVLSLFLMYLLYTLQGDEDSLLVRATDWCMHRFVFRMHIS